MQAIKLKPVIRGEGWPIAPSAAHLDALLPHKYTDYATDPVPNRLNDHCFYQTPDGQWHLWACVCNTPVHHVFEHWQGESPTQSPWRFTGEILRCDRNRGESLVWWKNADFMQAPFIVRENGRWHMVFGGYAAGFNAAGEQTVSYNEMENQICLMTSDDGYHWTRYDNGFEQSRLFAGPGASRDPCLLKVGTQWLIYYTGHLNADAMQEGIFVRTSPDLLHWSEARLAHYIPHDVLRRKAKNQEAFHTNESPLVVERGGCFYLFRSGGYAGDGGGSVSVFRSENPFDFGINTEPLDKYVCNINFHAPEILVDRDGQEYISKIFDPRRGHGIYLAPLTWQPA